MWGKKKPQPTRSWEIGRYIVRSSYSSIVRSSYSSDPDRSVDFIQLRVLAPNGAEARIFPHKQSIGVDPAVDDFAEQMQAYERKAQLAMMALQGGMVPEKIELPALVIKADETATCAECDELSEVGDYFCSAHRAAVT